MQPLFDKQAIEAFKQSLSITAVAEQLGLAPMKGKVRCLYPNRHSHGDRTPSVSLSETRGLFKCWVCQDVRGDSIELVCQVRNCNFPDAIQWLRDTFPQANAALTQHHIPESSHSNSSAIPAVHPRQAPQPKSVSHSEVLSLAVNVPERPEHWREKAILGFLKMLAPVEQPGSSGHHEARDYLVNRKIFLRTWNVMRLRWVDDYGRINELLQKSGEVDLLQEVGILNEHGNLRFYKHRLILPYLDAQNRPLHFQARATDYETTPKELSLRGSIPCPYNAKILDGKPGLIYLCEGPIDTLTLIERNVPAVGVPGVSHLKNEWISMFANKIVTVCFDNDEAGRQASLKVIQAFTDQGIDAKALTALPDGSDINDWFVRGK